MGRPCVRFEGTHMDQSHRGRRLRFEMTNLGEPSLPRIRSRSTAAGEANTLIDYKAAAVSSAIRKSTADCRSTTLKRKIAGDRINLEAVVSLYRLWA